MEAILDEMATVGQYEPSIASNDPLERKLARQLRLQRRLEAMAKAAQEEEEGEVLEEEEVEESYKMDWSHQNIKNPIIEQIYRSREFLFQLKRQAEEFCTNIRVANEKREVDRRQIRHEERQKMIAMLEKEAAEATVNFKSLATEWETIMEYKDPLHIHEGIAEQQAKFDEIIKQKDMIISMLREEIKKAETQYSLDQAKQNNDISTLSKRVQSQSVMMKRACMKELENIESVVLEQRKQYLDFINNTWNELKKSRDETERNQLEQKMRDIDEFNNIMVVLENDFNELYRKSKIKLEGRVDELTQEFEKLKACALLNRERLDYNYLVLKKREDENVTIKSQQKRKLNSLGEYILNMRKKIRNYQLECADKAKKMEQQIKGLKRSILDIEGKADHFAKVNNETFKQVWIMNEEKAQILYQNILDIDRLIHENQLGVDWAKPKPLEYHYEGLVDYKAILRVLDSVTPKKTKEKRENPIPFLAKETKAYRRLLKHMLEQIAKKGDFLVEGQIEAILLPYNSDEKNLVSIDNVFNALNITNQEDVDLICQYFVPFMHCPICSAERELTTDNIGANEAGDDTFKDRVTETVSQSTAGATIEPSQMLVSEDSVMNQMIDTASSPGDISECSGPSIHQQSLETKAPIIIDETNTEKLKTVCSFNHPLVISPIYVLKALRKFLADYHETKPRVPTIRDRLLYERNTPSRVISDTDLAIYWQRYTKSLAGGTTVLWEYFLHALKKYYELLLERDKISKEVDCLRRHNIELKYLMVNYTEKDKFDEE